ncbi:MAG TPA: hypothetical protein VLE24_08315 [Methyloceanibacter sp.]|nr:hypothetical protein [Methyloceanibacter sp.]
MGQMNAGYGSELHLLRMLGRHRQRFDRQVLAATDADAVEWLDFPSGGGDDDGDRAPVWDREWQHLNFLREGTPAKVAWAAAWPTHRTGPNWDAIGQLTYQRGPTEWFLVEAKANIEELGSACQATDPNSLSLIEKTIAATKVALGVPNAHNWMSGYYQHCNRLAALHILNTNQSPARLAYIYFCGDHGGVENGRTRTCPASVSGWKDSLRKQEEHVGLPPGHPLENRMHKLFVDTRCLETAKA